MVLKTFRRTVICVIIDVSYHWTVHSLQNRFARQEVTSSRSKCLDSAAAIMQIVKLLVRTSDRPSDDILDLRRRFHVVERLSMYIN